jgi:urease accessory protein
MNFFRQEELLRLIQLSSPMLPIGAYAYSQGLEYAVSSDWVTDEESIADWILGLLNHAHANLDVPVLARLHQAWKKGDDDSIRYWNDYLFASRETSEMQSEERQLSQALCRLLNDLDITVANDWTHYPRGTFLLPFSLGASYWRIPLEDTISGYLWTWSENQILAAIKLVPLGQTAGQKILSKVIAEIPDIIKAGLLLKDDEIGFSTPGQGVASALHETQYSRLFRS